MYEVAHHYKEKLHQKAYALKKKEEIQELSHCTFEPKLNKKYEYSEVRYQDFYEGVPNGFKVVIVIWSSSKLNRESLKDYIKEQKIECRDKQNMKESPEEKTMKRIEAFHSTHHTNLKDQRSRERKC